MARVTFNLVVNGCKNNLRFPSPRFSLIATIYINISLGFNKVYNFVLLNCISLSLRPLSLYISPPWFHAIKRQGNKCD